MQVMEAMVVTESVTVSLSIKNVPISPFLHFPICFKVVTAGEEVMVTVMEEDTAEVIGVDVTQIWQFEI